ncbi:class F sortase [Streptomyces sp. NPDC005805]|uniref:class F sortase n=1 Tax=Streptomyces sp. NPDC005805 TaxID=3157068 RepID=UPI0033EC0A64
MTATGDTARRGAWCTVLCVLLFGVFLVRGGALSTPAGGPPRPAPAAAAPDRAAPLPPSAAPLPHAVPRRVAVPSAGIDAPVAPVGLDADGWVAAPPPERAGTAGWYTGAVSPGQRGTAVVVGHVDNDAGPAVFYALGSLKPGTRVEVARADGRTAVFALYAVELFPQQGFPARSVYADGPRAEIRLITCGGAYSPRDGYTGNVVASGRLVAVR